MYTIVMADLKPTITLLDQRCLDDKLTTLFKPRLARWHSGTSFEIRRSVSGSVATSLQLHCRMPSNHLPGRMKGLYSRPYTHWYSV